MDRQLVRSPVYQQLNQRLRTVLADDYQCGDRFLTEREIAERFQVSRTTANKALASLVSEGFLEFRKGIGTFVRRDVIDYDVRSLVSFTERATAAGKTPRTELLRFGKKLASDAGDSVSTALGVGGDEVLWEMERIRFANETPVILEFRFVIEALCPKLTRSQAEGSLYRAWTESHGLKIVGADEVIRAVKLTAAESRRLRTTPGSPALEVVSVGLLENDSPLWWERTLYRGDQCEFYSRLGRIQSVTPARGRLRLPWLRGSPCRPAGGL